MREIIKGEELDLTALMSYYSLLRKRDNESAPTKGKGKN